MYNFNEFLYFFKVSIFSKNSYFSNFPLELKKMGNEQSSGGGDFGGGSGGGFERSSGGRNDRSFGSAFKEARDQMGPGHTFEWRGKSYTTNRADDPPNRSDDALSNGAFRNDKGPHVGPNIGSSSNASSGALNSNWMDMTYSGASSKTAASDKLTISGNEASRKV